MTHKARSLLRSIGCDDKVPRVSLQVTTYTFQKLQLYGLLCYSFSNYTESRFTSQLFRHVFH